MNIWTRWFLAAAVVAAGFVGYQQVKKVRAASQKELRQETTLRYLNRKILAKKLVGSDPLWMQEQIEEDFGPLNKITSAHVDETFKTIKKNYPSPYWIRYRIVDRKLYRFFPEGEPISTLDNDVERALKAMTYLTPLQDIDFIIGFEDGIPIEPMPEGFYLTEDPKLQAPILISAKRKGVLYAILIPDWRSISWWWARDIQIMENTSHQTEWNEKINRGVWRGSLTKGSRLKLCEMAKKYPDALDAKLNVKVNCADLQAYIEKNGMFGDRIAWDDFLKYKFLPILDGVMCAAPALQWRLLSKCLTLKQESEDIQWFYKAIHPYEHYVPIQNDLSDLIQQIEWAKLHDPECQEISKRAYAFAKDHLMMEDVYHYFIRVLERYGKLQKVNRSEMIAEMATNPCWVCIQHRKKLKKQLSLQSHPLTIHASTPY